MLIYIKITNLYTNIPYEICLTAFFHRSLTNRFPPSDFLINTVQLGLTIITLILGINSSSRFMAQSWVQHLAGYLWISLRINTLKKNI